MSDLLMEKNESATCFEMFRPTSRVSKKKVQRKDKGIAAAASEIGNTVSPSITKAPPAPTTAPPSCHPITDDINWQQIVANGIDHPEFYNNICNKAATQDPSNRDMLVVLKATIGSLCSQLSILVAELAGIKKPVSDLHKGHNQVSYSLASVARKVDGAPKAILAIITPQTPHKKQ